MKDKTKRSHKFIDRTNYVYNRLTVIKLDKIKNHRTWWICTCVCGNTLSVTGSDLVTEQVKSCGCLRHEHSNNFKDLTGMKFNNLTILKFDQFRNKQTYWFCKCDCGNKILVAGAHITDGHTKSCGCIQLDAIRKANTTHGMSNSRLNIIWKNMKARCINPEASHYKDYGGRGIKLCDEWLTFEGFYIDNGESYNKHVEEFGEKDTTADRFPDVNGNYEKDNFKWSTLEQQSRNKRDSSKTENYDEHIHWKKILRARLNSSLRNSASYSSIENYLGCSLQEFRKYIQSLWAEDMTWNNRGQGVGKWNIDHITGCNNFDLSKEEDRLVCWNYKNLRPMWDEDHKKKSRRTLNHVSI